MDTDTISSKFAGFAGQLTYGDFSEDQVYKIKTYFLDWLGSAYAGKTQPPVRAVLDVVHSLGGAPESTIIPQDSKTNCLLAALANGVSSHVVEMDDLHRESVLHPAAAITPAVFAAAERERVSGPELIVGIAAGYEVGIRVAMAVGQSHYHYWHTTATCGTFGAAAGAAKILGLNEEQIVWALGSAGTQASGLWEFLAESAMSKQLHLGKAALNGLLAALLAQQGFTGAQKILEGKKGFFRATSKDFDEEKCLAALGHDFMFERNSLKYHASCGHTHSAIDAVLEATAATPIMAHEIDHVHVSLYQAALDLLGNVEPNTPYVAKFNLPFCVATALRYARVGLEAFSPERLEDPEILRLMDKINARSDPELSRGYPRKWPARVEIVMRDGRRIEGASEYPKGEPENPLSEEELFQKFKDLTEDLLPQSAADTLMERAMNLERLSDVSLLLKIP